MILDQELSEKHKFITWYIDATPEDDKKARLTDEKKYEELLDKYAYEISVINRIKSQSLPEHVKP